jgi:hypothetical protein
LVLILSLSLVEGKDHMYGMQQVQSA